ncbi:MAG: DUF4340 domain-containing protein, partial [Planctomycetota bacterium]
MRANLILLILAVLLGIPTVVTLSGEEAPMMGLEDFPQLLPGFNPNAVNIVTLTRKRPAQPGSPQPAQPQIDRLDFFRSDTSETGWVLGPHPHLQGLPIKDGMVESHILDHLKSIRLDQEALALADADQDDLAERHLTEDSALLITCVRGVQAREALAELFKGIRAQDLNKEPGAVQGYFVCRKDKPKQVVLYDPGDPWELILDANEWVTKVIYDILMGDVESFRIKNTLGELAFKKKKGSQATWEKGDAEAMKKLGAVRQGEVTRLLEQFRKVTAEAYEGPTRVVEERLGLDKISLAPGKSKYEFQATLKDGREYWLRVGGQVPNSPHHYAVSSNSDFVFTIPGYAVRPLDVDASDLCDPAPPEPAPAGKKDPP